MVALLVAFSLETDKLGDTAQDDSVLAMFCCANLPVGFWGTRNSNIAQVSHSLRDTEATC